MKFLLTQHEKFQNGAGVSIGYKTYRGFTAGARFRLRTILDRIEAESSSPNHKLASSSSLLHSTAEEADGLTTACSETTKKINSQLVPLTYSFANLFSTFHF